MAKQFIPLEKRSKKEQAAYHKKQRSSWGTVKPCTCTHRTHKIYDRKRQAAMDRRNGILKGERVS